MAKDVKLLMVAAASSALKYQSESNADLEEVMKTVIKNLNSRGNEKLAEIASINHVLKYKQKNPKALEKQILQDLTDNSDRILNSIKNQSVNIGEVFR